MTKKYDRREPCGNCPFRKSAPLAHWHPDEYKRLADIDSDPFNMRIFGCHKDKYLPARDRGMCVGWLLNQRKRGLPSIGLRVRLGENPMLILQLEEAVGDEDCYETISELVALNLKRDQEINPERYSTSKTIPNEHDILGATKD